MRQANRKAIYPQPGKQTKFIQSNCDITIYGGAKGGGKSYGLLLDPLYYMDVKGFNGVIFRRTSSEIRKTGGLWDKATEVYSGLASLGMSALTVDFGSSQIQFGHIEYDKNVNDWQGVEICYLAFDELTHFTEKMFWTLMTCNRSVCGVKPYIKATCNPDPDSWVKKFIQWWIDPDTGYAIEERGGAVRWFVRDGENILWADSYKECIDLMPNGDERVPKSVTFIPSTVYDNKKLIEIDKNYLSNLHAQGMVLKERFLKGNWNIRQGAGLLFKRSWFEVVPAAPKCKKRVRYWDCAATKQGEGSKDPDWTSGLLLSKDEDGIYYIENVNRFRENVTQRNRIIQNQASQDGKKVKIFFEQEPGSGGKFQVNYLVGLVSGYTAKANPVSGDKIARAEPASAQVEAGNVKVVEGDWNEDFFRELENFDGNPKKKDDQVDSFSGAFDCINKMGGSITGYYSSDQN